MICSQGGRQGRQIYISFVSPGLDGDLPSVHGPPSARGPSLPTSNTLAIHDNYERAAEFIKCMAEQIHTDDRYSTVGMLEATNEPVHAGDYHSEAADMSQTFYPCRGTASGTPRAGWASPTLTACGDRRGYGVIVGE
ncbi:Glucan endo-1,6-beta-glucosidase B [Tolypocladium ophioglossoides CBS 100239]|uniref:Glucan endo-1,6-beta-glucosidase B n=1 Tax=Tolypocladium ophioglossoides (strain CBS 100239) TaxID=1163406 RepID=A0A0L0N3C3_TOLOC|nr:Glucan endo-1,6-beta-glucosidase B [Tolypocladium ophioglossoides CBS 100239]